MSAKMRADMKVGKPSPELKNRNADLISDYNSHSFSLVELVKKYGITPQRIYAILKQAKKKSEAKSL